LVRGLRRVVSAPPRLLRRTCLRMLGRRSIGPGGGRIQPAPRRVKSCGVVVCLGCRTARGKLVFGVRRSLPAPALSNESIASERPGCRAG
jgi:hypothetical protein